MTTTNLNKAQKHCHLRRRRFRLDNLRYLLRPRLEDQVDNRLSLRLRLHLHLRNRRSFLR
jgi:hypothetical protein